MTGELAALVVGALVIVAPGLDWRLQLLVFAVLSLAASVGWRICSVAETSRAIILT